MEFDIVMYHSIRYSKKLNETKKKKQTYLQLQLSRQH